MEKLLAIAGIGQRVYGRWLFQRLLMGLIVIVGLTVVVAIVMSALLLGGLYGAYAGLLHIGVAMPNAMLMTAFLALLVVAGMVLVMQNVIKRLRQTQPTLQGRFAKVVAHPAEIVDAFIDGLLAGKHKRP